MVKILALLFCLIAVFVLSLGVMIYGWGLQPVSWVWIIGGWFGVIGITACLETIKAS